MLGEGWSQLLLAVTVLPVAAVYGTRAAASVRRWWRKRSRLDDINKQYERLRSVRQDAVYHHGWATSRGDYKEAESHERHVMDLDAKLKILRAQYGKIEAGAPVEEVDGVVVQENLKDR
mmetsp:Transcript_26700/g.75430  ORF Transcript_26700/g.75430 Transcript_26700/m.75430 type:complete len:119 (+) Transcript_26700:140-496(+)